MNGTEEWTQGRDKEGEREERDGENLSFSCYCSLL
jgi:hypothetical protein